MWCDTWACLKLKETKKSTENGLNECLNRASLILYRTGSVDFSVTIIWI